jgi:hypothetical protein
MNFTGNFYAISILVCFGATVASQLFGALWFSPVVLGRPWRRLLREDRHETEMKTSPMTFILSFAMQFLAASLLAGMLGPRATWLEGMQLGAILGIGFVLPALGTINLFELRPWTLAAIYVAYQIITLALMGTIIGQWG